MPPPSSLVTGCSIFLLSRKTLVPETPLLLYVKFSVCAACLPLVLLPRGAANAPSLEVTKAGLDGAPGRLSGDWHRHLRCLPTRAPLSSAIPPCAAGPRALSTRCRRPMAARLAPNGRGRPRSSRSRRPGRRRWGDPAAALWYVVRYLPWLPVRSAVPRPARRWRRCCRGGDSTAGRAVRRGSAERGAAPGRAGAEAGRRSGGLGCVVLSAFKAELKERATKRSSGCDGTVCACVMDAVVSGLQRARFRGSVLPLRTAQRAAGCLKHPLWLHTAPLRSCYFSYKKSRRQIITLSYRYLEILISRCSINVH